MSVKNMSIHRGLAELKGYNDRIQNAIRQIFVVANKRSNDKIEGKSIQEYKQSMQGNFDSVTALIKNYTAIKAAVVTSNAVTKVTIGGKSYTVAEAIETKRSIDYQKALLQQLKNQFLVANRTVTNENDKLPDKIEQYLKSILNDKRTPDEVALYTKGYEDKYTFELVDPVHVQEQITKLEEDILAFETDVDIVLSESNAVTTIDVELAD